VLLTEPFDVEKFKAALERKVEADVKEKRARMALFAEMAATLTPEVRRQLHNWFEERRKRFRRTSKVEDAPPPGSEP
jgi:Spy/CpxP family protein refolding chaperone